MSDNDNNNNDGNANGEEGVGKWLDDNTNFITVMIIVATVLTMAGIVLLFCMCRYPSFGFRDKLGDLFDGDDDDDEDSKDGRGSDVRSLKDTLGRIDPNFRKKHSTAGLSSATTVPSLRLPTPGGAPPSNRLPPLNPVNTNAFTATVANVGMGGVGVGGVPAVMSSPYGKEDAGSSEMVLEDDLESIYDATILTANNNSNNVLMRSESADSGAVLDDVKPRIVGLSWSKEVASDIPSVDGASPRLGAWTTEGRLPSYENFCVKVNK